jgi:hypothetical protein
LQELSLGALAQVGLRLHLHLRAGKSLIGCRDCCLVAFISSVKLEFDGTFLLGQLLDLVGQLTKLFIQALTFGSKRGCPSIAGCV